MSCQPSREEYEINPNLIFAINEKLDPFNDGKARKLCQYHIIRDYNNAYSVPKEKNYIFKPALLQESSWLNAVFAVFLTAIIEVLLILIFLRMVSISNLAYHKKNINQLLSFHYSSIKKKALIMFEIILTLALAFFIYMTVFREITMKAYCKKITAIQLYNFRQAIRQNGANQEVEENEQVGHFLRKLNQKCVDHE